MRRGRRTLVLALAPALVALAGCALAPAEPPITSSLLDQMPAELPRRTASPTTLIVFPPEARPAVDGTPMAYTLRAHHLAYFAHNQWAESPPQMLQPLLLRTLEATGAFAAVVTPPHRTTGTLGLRVEIVELVQDFSQEVPVLRFALRARLGDEGANRVIATREFRVDEAMQQKTPAAGVVAANAGVARVLGELARWVLDNAH
jgi:cholesterol transport system auxiliary component